MDFDEAKQMFDKLRQYLEEYDTEDTDMKKSLSCLTDFFNEEAEINSTQNAIDKHIEEEEQPKNAAADAKKDFEEWTDAGAPEPKNGETITKTTISKSKDGLEGETTPEEDEMLSHFDNILQGLKGLQ